MTQVKSRVFRFAGMNIKGTPAMPSSAVAHDVKKGIKHADVLVFQEFRWNWYWIVLANVLGVRWGTSPGLKVGERHPVAGAQTVLWQKKHWRKIESRKMLLHHGYAKISEARYIRAVLLEDIESGLRCWFVTTHFVVKGDEEHDPDLRERIFRTNVARLGGFLAELRLTDWPIIMELDANVTLSSDHYPLFHNMIHQLNGRMHGVKGVEYLIVFQAAKARVQVIRTWTIPTTELKTDHEGRGLTARLVGAEIMNA